LQMQTQQEAVMPGDAAAQRRLQFGWSPYRAKAGCTTSVATLRRAGSGSRPNRRASCGD
jgi:hypothetical protein